MTLEPETCRCKNHRSFLSPLSLAAISDPREVVAVGRGTEDNFIAFPLPTAVPQHAWDSQSKEYIVGIGKGC